MNHFIFLISVLFSTTCFSSNNGPERSGHEGETQAANKPTNSFKDPDLSNTNTWAGSLDFLNPSHESFKNNDSFNPLLEVNTNRGTFKTEFNLTLPANLLEEYELNFSYNHKQEANYGYGIGWDISIPKLESRILYGKETLLLYNIEGSGAYIKSTCLDIQENECFRAELDENFFEIVKNESGYKLKTTGLKSYHFRKDGSLAKISIKDKSIHFKFTDGVIAKINSPLQGWQLIFNYTNEKQNLPIYRYNAFYNLPISLDSILFKNNKTKKLVLFSYIDSYLSSVKWDKSEKTIFKGDYAFVSSKEKQVTQLKKIDFKKEVYTTSTFDHEIEIKKTKENEDSILYIDLNGDLREDKLVLHTKEWNSKINKILKNIPYEDKGRSECNAHPKWSEEKLVEKLNEIPVPVSFYWAQVKDDKLDYIKDEKISKKLSSTQRIKNEPIIIGDNIAEVPDTIVAQFPFFSYEITKKKKWSRGCKTLNYYDVTPHQTNIIVADINFDEIKDLLFCPVTTFKKDQTLGSLIKRLVYEGENDFPAIKKSAALTLALDVSKTKNITPEEASNTNIIPNIYQASKVDGPKCHQFSQALDYNHDGLIDIYNGDSVSLLSPIKNETIPTINKNVSNNIKADTEDKNIRVRELQDGFELFSSEQNIITDKALINYYKGETQNLNFTTKRKRLVKTASDFGGNYQISYKYQNNTDIVASVQRIAKDGNIESTSEYVYADTATDPLTGAFVGYFKTTQKYMSAARIDPEYTDKHYLRDNRPDIVLLASRARLNGRILTTETYSPLSQQATRVKYFWEAKELSPSRIFVYPHAITKELIDGDIYTNKITNHSSVNWLEIGQELIFPLEQTQTELIQDDIINIFSPPQEKYTTTYYTNPNDNIRLVSKYKTYSSKENSTTHYKYDDAYNLITKYDNTREVVYNYDQLERVISINDDFGSDYEIGYLKNSPYPNLVNKDGIINEISRESIWGLEKTNLSEKGLHTYNYAPDMSLKSITLTKNGQNTVIYSKSAFASNNDQTLSPIYTLKLKDNTYDVNLNSFGELTKVSSLVGDQYITFIDQVLLDKKVISQIAPYSDLSPKKVTTRFNYDYSGRTSKITEDFFKGNVTNIKYSKNCSFKEVNGQEIESSCNDIDSKLKMNTYLDESFYLNYSSLGNVTQISNGLSWSYDEEFNINQIKFENYSINRETLDRGHKSTFNNQINTIDDNGRLESTSISTNDVKNTYKDAKLVAQTLTLSDGKKLTTKFDYKYGNVSKVESPYHSTKYTYDIFDRIKNEKITTSNLNYNLSYAYLNGVLESLNPYISKINYNPNGAIETLEYTNGLKANFKYDALTQTLKFVSYKYNGKSILSNSISYDELKHVKNTKYHSPLLGKDLNREYTYSNFRLETGKSASYLDRGHSGFLLESKAGEYEHCGIYLCKVNSQNKLTKYFFTSELGLKAGTNTKDFNPHQKGSFYRINQSEALIEGHFVKFIKIAQRPIGVIVDEDFYPLFTNYKGEVIGALTPDGSQLLFVRNFSDFGEKELISTKDPEEVAKLDNLLIWSFGRMIHSPLEDSANKDLYFSASRTYSVSAKAWTAIDPLLAWSPESLLTSHGNFNPLRYCDNDPVNFVDPSGYATIESRSLDKAPLKTNNPESLANKMNLELKHEHIRFNDGKTPSNIGFHKNDKTGNSELFSENMEKFDYEKNKGEMEYNDAIARKAVDNIKDQIGEYKLIGNNCQDFISQFRKEYERLEKNKK